LGAQLAAFAVGENGNPGEQAMEGMIS